MSGRLDWEAARRSDNIRKRGSEPLAKERATQPRLLSAKRAGVCHACRRPIRKGDLFAFRNPGRLCQPCAIKAFEDGRI